MKNKICTSIEQSKKLIELGIDINSADLVVIDIPFQGGDRFKFIRIKFPNDIFPSITDGKSELIPAWSLSALLDVYPMTVGRDMDMYCCWQNSKNLHSRHYDNPVDACYEMILKLHEQKLL